MYQHVEFMNFTNRGMGITTVKLLCQNAVKHKHKYVVVSDFNSISSWTKPFLQYVFEIKVYFEYPCVHQKNYLD